MTATTMHFGPEWMRPKQPPAPTRSQHDSSPDPGPATHATAAHPYIYTRDELLAIYKEAGGHSAFPLPPDVQHWEGIVRETGADPAALKDMSEFEKKLFQGPLNSEIRRRQSTDYLSPMNTPALGGDRPRLMHANSGAVSPMREKFGALRRRDSDGLPSTLPRKLSLSSTSGPPREAALPSPRARGFTPGFDGILSTQGESWMAKRRAAEGMPARPVNGSWRAGDPGEGEVKGLGIKEEAEESTPPAQGHVNGNMHDEPDSYLPGQTTVGGVVGDGAGQGPGQNPVLPSQPEPDLKSVEWSYLDPQGNIQGPFRADLMQKWHDDGYFTPDLRMKRTRVDGDWITVGDLLTRIGHPKIFLAPIPPPPSVAPPGLLRRVDSSSEGIQPGTSGTPHQPIPNRAIRSSTLDNYLGSASPSESPASSYGAARFGNGTPDGSGFGGRAVPGYYPPGEPILGPRLATITSGGDALRGGVPYGNASPARANTLDSYQRNGFNNSPALAGSPANMGGFPPNFGSPTVSAFGAQTRLGSFGNMPSSTPFGNDYGSVGGPSNQFGSSALDERVETAPRIPYNGAFGNGQPSYVAPGQSSLTSSPAIPMSTAALQNIHSSGANQAIASPVSMQQHATAAASTFPTQSPWDNPDAAVHRRPRPADAIHTKVSNPNLAAVEPVRQKSGSLVHTPLTPQQPVTNWPQVQAQQSGSVREQSPWAAASKGIVDEGWGEEPGGPNRLTVSNLKQHTQQQQQQQHHNQPTPSVPESPAPGEALAERLTDAAEVSTSKPATPATEALVDTPATKSRRKSAVQTQPKSQTPVIEAPSPGASTPAKTAPWSVDDDKKSKPSGLAMGFREIQEAEAKRAEATKTADKTARAASAAPASAEDATPFTTSWGLPTSKAGAARGAKDAGGSAASPAGNSPAVTPVWSQAAAKAPTTKKTMKEIQEEEEKRKKTAKEKESAAATARRAYAETTTKTVPSAQTVGSAWTTVGTKPSTPVAVRSSAPVATASASVPAAPAATRPSNGTATRTQSAAIVAKVVPPAPKVMDDFPMPPSGEFMRWLADTLKGLSSSVSLEDITSMLLSFPLDPDPSTTEIISDLIYANSTTMDGRRFAADYVSRRKADAATRPRTAAAPSAPARGTSIADVVKAQPKPQPGSEWSGFKVVNKKKKGPRA